jgi:hypothetical protein
MLLIKVEDLSCANCHGSDNDFGLKALYLKMRDGGKYGPNLN